MTCQGAPALLEAKREAVPLFSVATLDFSILPFTMCAPAMRTWPGPRGPEGPLPQGSLSRVIHIGWIPLSHIHERPPGGPPHGGTSQKLICLYSKLHLFRTN